MLISQEEVIAILKTHNITPRGVLHIGAHECEELPFYKRIGINEENIIWIDAIPKKVEEAKARGIKNIYQAVVTDADGTDVEFKVTNNVQSSSILDFGTHAKHHSWVHFVDTLKLKTSTIQTLYKENGWDMAKYDFWNFDIQGAELMALKGAGDILSNAKVLYLEVNTEEVYKGCALIGEIDAYVASYGFERVCTKMTGAGWGDAIFVKRSAVVITTGK